MRYFVFAILAACVTGCDGAAEYATEASSVSYLASVADDSLSQDISRLESQLTEGDFRFEVRECVQVPDGFRVIGESRDSTGGEVIAIRLSVDRQTIVSWESIGLVE